MINDAAGPTRANVDFELVRAAVNTSEMIDGALLDRISGCALKRKKLTKLK